MINYISYYALETKIRRTTAHDIIMAMVNGLRKPKTDKVDMGTYGAIRNGVCFGCAATNAVLTIMGANEDVVEYYIYTSHRPPNIGATPMLGRFDYAVNYLRQGRIQDYNTEAIKGRFAKITPIPATELPVLNNDYTEEQLKEYEKLAKYQLIK